MSGHEPKKKLHTVRFQYPFGSTIPKEEEFTALLKEKGVAEDSVEAIYSEMKRKSILVKFKTQVLADDFLDKAGYIIGFKYSNEVKVDLKISDANVELTMVRCFELQPEIDDDEIEEVFKAYGVVRSVTRERTNPKSGYSVYNGIRKILMERKAEIPNLVTIDGVSHRVQYDGQKEICFRCQQEGHKRFQCPLSVNNRLPNGRPEKTTAGTISRRNYETEFPEHVPANITVSSNDNTTTATGKGNTNTEVQTVDSNNQHNITVTTIELMDTMPPPLTAVLPIVDAKQTTQNAEDMLTTTAQVTDVTMPSMITADLTQHDDQTTTSNTTMPPPQTQQKREGRTTRRDKTSSGSNDDNELKRRNVSSDPILYRTRLRSRSRSTASMSSDGL